MLHRFHRITRAALATAFAVGPAIAGSITSALLLLTPPRSPGQAPELDRLRWSSTPTQAVVGVPAMVRVEALDAADAGFPWNGNAVISAWTERPAPRLLITEVSSFFTVGVEIANVSDEPVDVGGWSLRFHDRISWPGTAGTFVVPPGVVCRPGETLSATLRAPPGPRPSREYLLQFPLAWDSQSATNVIAVQLIDPEGRTADVFAACSGFPDLLEGLSESTDGRAHWSGLPAPVLTNTPTFIRDLSYQRSGSVDHNNAGDWFGAMATPGSIAPGMRVPFTSGGLRPIPVSPTQIKLAEGEWTGPLTLHEAASRVWLRVDDLAGHGTESGPFPVAAGPRLALVVPPDGLESTAGFLGLLRIQLPFAVATNVTVSLAASPGGELILANAVVLPAGSLEATVAVTNLDDGILDGPRTVRLSASAPGFATASGTLVNYDDDGAGLRVTLPAAAREGDGVHPAGGLVSIPVPAGLIHAIQLRSFATNKVQVPPLVYLAGGATSTPFQVTFVNNDELEGPQSVQVTAEILTAESPGRPGRPAATNSVTVADNDEPILFINPQLETEEGAGVVSNAFEVYLRANVPSNVVVRLTSANPSRLRIPTEVVVPKGARSVWTSYTPGDDLLTNGVVTVPITAEANGFLPATQTIWVHDDELHGFRFFPPSRIDSPRFPITIWAQTIDGHRPSSFGGTAALTVQGPNGPVPISPGLITFTNGVWAGFVTIDSPGARVRIFVTEAGGATGQVDSVELPLVNLATAEAPIVSDLAFNPIAEELIAGVISGPGGVTNALAGLAPATGEILWSIPLQTTPGRLAVSKDFYTVYVGDQSTGGVVRVSLLSRSINLRFPIGTNASVGPLRADDMEIVPGSANSVVVVRKNAAQETEGVVLYEGGVPKPAIVNPAPANGAHFIGFAGSPDRIYFSSPAGRSHLRIRTNGLFTAAHRANGQFASDFEFEDGLMFNSSGVVLQPDTLRTVAQLPVSGVVRPDPINGRVLFLESSRLRVFDLQTWKETASIPVAEAPGNPARLVTCAADRIAYRSATGRLVLARCEQIPTSSPTDLRVALELPTAPIIVGETYTVTLSVSNAGPVAAAQATAAYRLPPGLAQFVSATATQGGCTHTNGTIGCTLGTLPAGGGASATMTIRAGGIGPAAHLARVTGGSLVPGNNLVWATNFARFDNSLPLLSIIDVPAAALAFAPSSNHLWVAIDDNAYTPTNTLVGYVLGPGPDPAPMPTASRPNRLMVSPNGAYLHAISATSLQLHNLRSVERITIPAEGITDAVPLAGSGTTVAVSAAGTVTIYDGSRPRGEVAPATQILEGHSTLPRLYGTYAGSVLRRFTVSATGVRLVDDVSPGIAGVSDFRSIGRYLVSDNGAVIDPELAVRVADLDVKGRGMDVDSGAQEVAFLLQPGVSGRWSLVGYGLTNSTPAWVVPLGEVSGTPAGLINCGRGLYAFYNEYGTVHVVNSAEATRPPLADLEISVAPTNRQVIAGTRVVIQSIVRNLGDAPTAGTILTNRVNPGTFITNFGSAYGTCTLLAPEVLTCNVGSVVPGATELVEFEVFRTNAGPMTATITAGHLQFDPNPANNVAVFSGTVQPLPRADLAIREFVTLSPDGQLHATITVSNAGPEQASAVVATELPPQGSILVSASNDRGPVDIVNGSLAASIGTLPAGESARIEVIRQPGGTIAWIHRAEVTSTTPDPFTQNNATVAIVSSTGEALARTVPVEANDAVYDDARRLLYASTTTNSGPFSRALVAINPDSGAVVHQHPLTHPAGPLAIASDGSLLYAGYTHTGLVERISLPLQQDPVTVTPIALGPARIPFDLATPPGQPRMLAVSHRNAGNGANPTIELFDEVTPRTSRVEVTIASGAFHLGFADSTNTLFAHGPGGFQAVAITPEGLSADPAPLAIPGAEPFTYDSGRLYCDQGSVIDPAAKSVTGFFPLSPGFVAPDIASGRVYSLSRLANGSTPLPLRILAYDASSSETLYSLAIPAAPGLERGLLRLRAGELALRTSGAFGHLLLLRVTPLDIPSSDLNVQTSQSPALPAVGGIVTHTVTIRNEGPRAAPGTWLVAELPPGASFVSATPPQGSCTYDQGVVRCDLGVVPLATPMPVAISIRVNTAGSVTTRFAASSLYTDPEPIGNSATVATTFYPTPTISILDTASLEGSSRNPLQFKIRLSNPIGQGVGVRISTADDTAKAGVDYDPTNFVTLVVGGTVERLFTLPSAIRGNTVLGTNRQFKIRLSNPVNATLGRAEATAIIVDDDAPVIRPAGVSIAEGQSGRSDAIFNLALPAPSTTPVAIHYSTHPGSAQPETGLNPDFQSRAGMLIFEPGTTNKQLRVPVYADRCTEADELFQLELEASGPVQLVTNEVAGLIVNDDPLAELLILQLEPGPAPAAWTVHFQTQCEVVYRLERGDSLGLWQTVAGPIAGTGAPASLTDPEGPGTSQAFYRIAAQPTTP